MKIRIKGNALRFRLTRPEVEQFAASGKVTDKINFGITTLQYALCSTPGNQLTAAFENNCVTVYLPAACANEWLYTDKIGYENKIALNGSGENLFLLVEKDFVCMDKGIEDQSDHYPNPFVKDIYEH